MADQRRKFKIRQIFLNPLGLFLPASMHRSLLLEGIKCRVGPARRFEENPSHAPSFCFSTKHKEHKVH